MTSLGGEYPRLGGKDYETIPLRQSNIIDFTDYVHNFLKFSNASFKASPYLAMGWHGSKFKTCVKISVDV